MIHITQPKREEIQRTDRSSLDKFRCALHHPKWILCCIQALPLSVSRRTRHSMEVLDFQKNTITSKKCSNYFLLFSLNLSKNDFEASYVDQHMAAAGAWNSILGFHPLISPTYPSRFIIVLNTSPIELLAKRSHPHTP